MRECSFCSKEINTEYDYLMEFDINSNKEPKFYHVSHGPQLDFRTVYVQTIVRTSNNSTPSEES